MLLLLPRPCHLIINSFLKRLLLIDSVEKSKANVLYFFQDLDEIRKLLQANLCSVECICILLDMNKRYILSHQPRKAKNHLTFSQLFSQIIMLGVHMYNDLHSYLIIHPFVGNTSSYNLLNEPAKSVLCYFQNFDYNRT